MLTSVCRLWAYRHVGFAAGVHSLGHRVDQVAADAKVAHLHLTLSVDQHVGRLHVCEGREGFRQSWGGAVVLRGAVGGAHLCG